MLPLFTAIDYPQCRDIINYLSFSIFLTCDPAVMAQWLGCRTRNHKVASSSPATAVSSFGDWFTQPYIEYLT